MKFLTKLGQVLLTVTQIVTGIGPFFPKQLEPVTRHVDKLMELASIITTVEVIGQKLAIPGDKKLEGAAPLIAQSILQSSLLVDKKISDPVLFIKGCTSIGSGLADVLNSLDSRVETENKLS